MKNNNRPNCVQILGIPFRVQHSKKVDGGKALGVMMGANHKIIIKSDVSDTEYESNLLHEILHAILYVSGQSEQLSDEHEEAIVLALEHGLSQIYQRTVKNIDADDKKDLTSEG
jgi:hypothetical protein